MFSSYIAIKSSHPHFFTVLILTQLFVFFAFFPFDAYAVDFTAKSEIEIRGEDAGLNVGFSSELVEENYVVVNIDLGEKKKIVAEIDYASEEVSVKSFSAEYGVPISITPEDIIILKILGESLGPVEYKTEDALVSFLSWLSEAPPGAVVDISVEQQMALLWTSLCPITGKEATGVYDIIPGIPIRRTVRQVGPCYFINTEDRRKDCFGRCGPGCNSPPDQTIQRFTQECLNHDLCAYETNIDPIGALPPCDNEWKLAASGFLFAPDCGEVTGIWNDNHGYVWDLTQELSAEGDVLSFVLSGKVDISSELPQCAIWDVQGTHIGADIVLTATNTQSPIASGCCSAFTYTSTLIDCNTAGGMSNNPCGRSSIKSLSRGKEATGIPIIVEVNFPSEISGNKEPVPGMVKFTDSNAGVNWAQFDILRDTCDGCTTPFGFDPGVSDLREGQFEFNMWCEGDISWTTRLTLKDEQENVSNPVTFSVKCNPVSEEARTMTRELLSGGGGGGP